MMRNAWIVLLLIAGYGFAADEQWIKKCKDLQGIALWTEQERVCLSSSDGTDFGHLGALRHAPNMIHDMIGPRDILSTKILDKRMPPKLCNYSKETITFGDLDHFNWAHISGKEIRAGACKTVELSGRSDFGLTQIWAGKNRKEELARLDAEKKSEKPAGHKHHASAALVR